MSDRRTHYVTTTDGVSIGGTVHGQGRPDPRWLTGKRPMATPTGRRCCRT